MSAFRSNAPREMSLVWTTVTSAQPTWSLWSGSQNLLALPTLSSEFGRHAFSYSEPSVWNNLPLSIWSLNSFISFTSHLKPICLLIINIYCPPATLLLLLKSVEPATTCASDSSLVLDCCVRYQVFVCMYVSLTLTYYYSSTVHPVSRHRRCVSYLSACLCAHA